MFALKKISIFLSQTEFRSMLLTHASRQDEFADNCFEASFSNISIEHFEHLEG
jgi:hypothetical protein